MERQNWKCHRRKLTVRYELVNDRNSCSLGKFRKMFNEGRKIKNSLKKSDEFNQFKALLEFCFYLLVFSPRRQHCCFVFVLSSLWTAAAFSFYLCLFVPYFCKCVGISVWRFTCVFVHDIYIHWPWHSSLTHFKQWRGVTQRWTQKKQG